jgi:hypothetical protein
VRNYSFLDFPSLYLVSTEGVLQAWEGRAYQYGMNNLRSMGYPVDGLKFDPDLVCASNQTYHIIDMPCPLPVIQDVHKLQVSYKLGRLQFLF